MPESTSGSTAVRELSTQVRLRPTGVPSSVLPVVLHLIGGVRAHLWDLASHKIAQQPEEEMASLTSSSANTLTCLNLARIEIRALTLKLIVLTIKLLKIQR